MRVAYEKQGSKVVNTARLLVCNESNEFINDGSSMGEVIFIHREVITNVDSLYKELCSYLKSSNLETVVVISNEVGVRLELSKLSSSRYLSLCDKTVIQELAVYTVREVFKHCPKCAHVLSSTLNEYYCCSCNFSLTKWYRRRK